MIRSKLHHLRCGRAAVAFGLTALLAFGITAAADVPSAPAGTMNQITVHGASLVGNLSGDSADRTVFVYLPPTIQRRNRAAIQSSTTCMAIV
jgi:hypothetical protein